MEGWIVGNKPKEAGYYVVEYRHYASTFIEDYWNGEVWKNLNSDYVVSYIPPRRRDKTLLMLNQWGRRTGKSHEAQALMSALKADLLIKERFCAHRPSSDSNTVALERVYVDDTNHISAPSITPVPINGGVFIIDDFSQGRHDTVVELINSLIMHGAKIVVVYGAFNSSILDTLELLKDNIELITSIRQSSSHTMASLGVKFDGIKNLKRHLL